MIKKIIHSAVLYFFIAPLLTLTLVLWTLLLLNSLAKGVQTVFFPPAYAEGFHFRPRIPEGYMLSIAPVWKWSGAEGYKQDILARYQSLLRKRGITNERQLKLLTAQLLQENGALDPLRHGDSGCSVGIPQRFVCQFGYSAKRFIKKYPEWESAEFQLTWMADHMKMNIEKYKDIRWAILAHNCPKCANAKWDNGYLKKVESRTSLLTL